VASRRRSNAPAKSHSKKKADRRAVAQRSPDFEWADAIKARLLASCHPRQRDYVEDTSLFISAVVGRGGGKTTADLARKIIKATSIPNARLVYIALTRTQAEQLAWAPLKLMFEQLGFRQGEDVFFNETKLTCTVARTGATIRLVGADKKSEVEKLRGQPFHEVTIDETASFPDKLLTYLLDEIIGPRLGDYNGTLCLIGSPGKVKAGTFYEATKRKGTLNRPYADRAKKEFKDWIGWSSHAWNLRDDVVALKNAERLYPRLCNLWRRALFNKKKNGWSDENPIWRREYLGEWAEDNTENIFKYRAEVDGTLWNRWKPFGDRKLEGVAMLKAAIAALPAEVRADVVFGYGIDLGARDPFALNIIAFSPSDAQRRFFHVYGFERREMYPRAIAELLIGEAAVKQVLAGNGLPDRLGGLFGVTDWPIAIVADLAGLGEQIILELQKNYGIKIKGAEKSRDYKYGAFEVVNGHLIDGRMVVIEGTDLEEQMTNIQWKPDEYGIPREDKAVANHSSDSWVYITQDVTAMFAPGSGEDTTASSSRSPVGERHADPDDELDDLAGYASSDDDGYSLVLSEGDYAGFVDEA